VSRCQPPSRTSTEQSYKTLLDDIVNTVNELTYQAINEIETALLNVPKEQLGFTSTPPSQSLDTNDTDASEDAAATEISAGIVKLESLLNSTIDKNFDKLEIYTLRNLLTVSNAKEDEGLENWIVLDHYKVCFLLLVELCGQELTWDRISNRRLWMRMRLRQTRSIV
jgi:DNA-directed RNA polymerase subunit K/omega